MAIQDKPNQQLIITYEDKIDNRIHNYSTAYTQEQANEVLMKCLERHGRGSNARIVLGNQLSI